MKKILINNNEICKWPNVKLGLAARLLPVASTTLSSLGRGKKRRGKKRRKIRRRLRY